MYDQQNKLIGYMVLAIVAYYVLSAIVPFITVALVGLVVWRIMDYWKRGRH